MNLKLQIGSFELYAYYEEGEVFATCVVGERTLFKFGRQFIKYFKCVQCGTKTALEDQMVRLCDSCRFEFVRYWENRWTDKK